MSGERGKLSAGAKASRSAILVVEQIASDRVVDDIGCGSGSGGVSGDSGFPQSQGCPQLQRSAP